MICLPSQFFQYNSRLSVTYNRCCYMSQQPWTCFYSDLSSAFPTVGQSWFRIFDVISWYLALLFSIFSCSDYQKCIFLLIFSDFRLFPDSRDFFGLVTCPWVSIKMWWAGHLLLGCHKNVTGRNGAFRINSSLCPGWDSLPEYRYCTWLQVIYLFLGAGLRVGWSGILFHSGEYTCCWIQRWLAMAPAVVS